MGPTEESVPESDLDWTFAWEDKEKGRHIESYHKRGKGLDWQSVGDGKELWLVVEQRFDDRFRAVIFHRFFGTDYILDHIQGQAMSKIDRTRTLEVKDLMDSDVEFRICVT